MRRCSTPDHGDQAEMVPKPPEVPRPNSTHPKNEKLKSKIETTQPTQSETTKNAEKIESERKSEVKGILKRRVTRRIVSASGNRGIIAASIKDSLELAGAVKDDSRTKVSYQNKFFSINFYHSSEFSGSDHVHWNQKVLFLKFNSRELDYFRLKLEVRKQAIK